VIELILLAAALVIILLGAELFTNGIEWFGRKLDLAEGAVGSVLAAVGTALPETMIPAVAILMGGGSAGHAGAEGVGVGAILGAPFMLSTLAMLVTGVGVIAFARRRRFGTSMPVDVRVLGTDVGYFFVAYTIAIGSAFVPAGLEVLRYAAVVALIGVYVHYVKRHFDAEPAAHDDELPALRLRRWDPPGFRANPTIPRLRVINLQVLLALGMILVGAVVFVDNVQQLAVSLRLDPALLALVIAPIATELPEKFNSLIWVRQGKDTLAMGNITGAMVFQSCFPTSIAILFAANAWTITGDNLLAFGSVAITFLSTAAIFIPMVRRRMLNAKVLLVGGIFYVLYLGLVVAHLVGIL
jgi:cation:H+ antiporter